MARAVTASNRLTLVDEEHSRPVGDFSLTEEALRSWTAGQRRCRARARHYWRPYTVFEHRNFYDVVEQCADCRNRRRAEFNKSGRRISEWHTDYRDNYLLPKGAARLIDAEDLHDELVLSDILSRRIVEVPDDEED